MADLQQARDALGVEGDGQSITPDCDLLDERGDRPAMALRSEPRRIPAVSRQMAMVLVMLSGSGWPGLICSISATGSSSPLGQSGTNQLLDLPCRDAHAVGILVTQLQITADIVAVALGTLAGMGGDKRLAISIDQLAG